MDSHALFSGQWQFKYSQACCLVCRQFQQIIRTRLAESTGSLGEVFARVWLHLLAAQNRDIRKRN